MCLTVREPAVGADDPVVEPLNVYGQSKYEGEVAVEKYAPHYYIVRIAWVFGLNGKKLHQDYAESRQNT